MWTDTDHCYRALLARDARFDGRFFVGVTSTGIYCRPVCRVRMPRRENCRFFSAAAAAEAAGFRPCLRCRPELAPGLAAVDASRRLAAAAATLIDDGALTDGDLKHLSARLGVSDRHLRRVFFEAFGVAPVAYAQTQRLLLAKRLLTDTALPVTEVAMAAGFGSLRRFNALFRQRYRLQPRDLRRTPEAAARDALQFELAYRPPYAWDAQLRFLAARAVNGVEMVRDDSYLRTALIQRGAVSYRGWLGVRHRPARHSLQVTVSAALAPVIAEVLARVRRQFDLAAAPDDIENQLGGIVKIPGLRVPGAFDGLEAAVRGILGQQITVRAACTLAGRLAGALGEAIGTPYPELSCTFPAAGALSRVDEDSLGRLGVIRTRARAIRALAQACAEDRLQLSPAADVEPTLAALRALPGIGEWTAQYIAMRALAWPDAFVHTDYGVMKAMGERSPARILERAEAWRPWRAYAAMQLWFSLEAATTHVATEETAQ